MKKSEIRIIILIILPIVALIHQARATMVVYIYTKDGIWLAADSYRSTGDTHSEDVCKIHETRFGILVKAGNSQGVTETGEVYSTDKEIEDLLASAKDRDTFQTTLRLQFKQEIEQELAFLVDDPIVTAQNLEQYKMSQPFPVELSPMLSRTAIMFNTNDATGGGKVLVVEPRSTLMSDSFQGTYYKYWAPSLYGWHSADSASLQKKSMSFAPSIHEIFICRGLHENG